MLALVFDSYHHQSWESGAESSAFIFYKQGVQCYIYCTRYT